MNILDIAQQRYTTKAFDSNKKIPQDQFNQILEVLRLSPSSVNIQPWHFFIAQTPEAKQKIAQSMQGQYSYNAPKVLDASHVVVFCTRKDIDDTYLEQLLEQDDKAGRIKDQKAKDATRTTRAGYVDFYRNTRKNLPEWLKNQTYLALGQTLYAAKAIGVDTTAMEGFDYKQLDQDLNLSDYTSVVVVSFGYHDPSDFNAQLPKSRLEQNDVFTVL